MRTVKISLFITTTVVLVLGIIVGLDYGSRQIYLALRKKISPPPPPPALPAFPRIQHSFYHHGLQPNAHGSVSYGPLVEEYFSNSLGMRDLRVREVARAEGPRILVVGDSFAEGIVVPYENTFAGLLGAQLEPLGIEVLNAGVSSYGPTIIQARLWHLLLEEKLRVDLVVFFLDISDVRDELFYETAADGSVKDIPYGPLRHKAEELRRIDNLCNWLEKNLEKNFTLVGALVRNLRLFLRSQGAVDGIRAFETIRDWTDSWPDYHGPYTDFVEQGLAKAKLKMSEIHGFLTERNIPLVVVIYPWPQQIRAGTSPSRAETEWLGWCRQEGVDCLNLFPLFVGKADPKETIGSYYIQGDCHWSSAGHRVVAEALGNHLQKNGYTGVLQK